MRAIAIAEDDIERSRQIRRLVDSNPTGGGCESRWGGTSEIPRVLVQYWHSASRIPNDVERCLSSWDVLRDAGFSRLLFHDESAREFLHRHFERRYLAAFDACPHPAMRCDLFRLCYLVARGGFYVDADEKYLGVGVDHLVADDRLKLQPLCYDPAARAMVKWSDVLATRKAPSNWIYYVNNNPLIARPGHPVLALALDRAIRNLLERNPARLRDIQSTTGPGNLSASLVAYALTSCDGPSPNFVLLNDWDLTSSTAWDLSYRRDARNWRTWMRMAPDDPALDALLDD